MAQNGSPAPFFDTDDDRTYFLTRLPIHPAFLDGSQEDDGNQDGNQDEKETQIRILRYCQQPRSKKEILEGLLGLTPQRKNVQRWLAPLLAQKLLALTLPDKPTSPNQQYYTTPKGLAFIPKA